MEPQSVSDVLHSAAGYAAFPRRCLASRAVLAVALARAAERMEPPAPPFLPPAPPLDDWQVALCVVAVGAAVLCLGCALQVKSSTSRVSSYDPRRDPTLVRTIECMLGCLSRHATSPDVVMQAVDALHASRHLLVPVGAAGSRRRPALGDLAGSPPGARRRPPQEAERAPCSL